MTLRTPRRRISPRTKHRYRVIKNFFRRALGSSSHPSIKISSSIAINVTDLKHRLVGIEHQLNEVSRHCQDINSLENISKPSCSITGFKSRLPAKHQIEHGLDREFSSGEAKILYKKSDAFRISEDSVRVPRESNDENKNIEVARVESQAVRVKKKKSKSKKITVPDEQGLSNRQTRSAYENFAVANSGDSYNRSTDDCRMAQYTRMGGCRYTHQDRINNERDYNERPELWHKQTNDKEKERRRHKNMNKNRDLDKEFIADIIRRQYKPIRMFGRKESELSQLSAPVCRDQEYSYNNYFGDCGELCSCCYDSNRNKYKRQNDLTEMRSICDTRLYSSNKARNKMRRRYMEAQEDSELYDLIPVKEKSSPKSRRKFAEDHMSYQYYKEVPPSPRSNRPQLNLKAQHCEEYCDQHHRKRRSPNRHEIIGKETLESDLSSDIPQVIEHQRRKIRNIKVEAAEQTRNESGTLNSLPNCNYVEQTCNETQLNKTQDTDLSIDKTDRALCEIKDILHSFLLEIKKDATASQCEKSDVTSKAARNVPNSAQLNSNNISMLQNGGPSFNYSNQTNIPPYIPAFTNPCCYPVVPVCPMNCLQNGYVMPSPSYTCANCSKEDKPKISSNSKVCSSETEELIKEIYKHVLEKPTYKQKERLTEDNKRILTSRSVGGSIRLSKRDVKIGTPKLKCYSKSCEAIAPRMLPENYYNGTYASYSDTVLERLSIEPTPSETVSETDFTLESTSDEKGKGNKFTKVLRSIGLFKKKKDVIEELSESESTSEVEADPRPQPFRQNIANYAMYEQEYYRPPPVPRPYRDYQEYRPPFHPNIPLAPDPYQHHSYPHMSYDHPYPEQLHADHPHHPHHPLSQYPTRGMAVGSQGLPHNQSFNNPAPNVPFCLKEVEVKSTATQSERKISFFKKIKTKMQEQARYDEYQRNGATQTADAPTKPGVFNWKNIQPKPLNKDPIAFSYMKQKQLAEGDVKMRDALLKRLFYKRNPFSPRNLIVRTLLGKDKSSYGEPPAMYRPKLFL